MTQTPPSSFWPRLNLACFLLAHLTGVFGLKYTFDTVFSLGAGVVVGLLAWAAWALRPHYWRRVWLAPLLLLITGGEILIFNQTTAPPPPPPPLEISALPDGTWELNRGGRMLEGRYYAALPEAWERDQVPPILGVARALKSTGAMSARVDWQVLRRGWKNRPHFKVRPLQAGEKPPGRAGYITATAILGPGRLKLDLGSDRGVQPGDVYALYHPAGQGKGGYLMVDQVTPDAAEALLVGGSLAVPQTADRAGTVNDVLSVLLTRAELAYMGQRKAEALELYQLALDLTRGQSEKARARVEQLQARP